MNDLLTTILHMSLTGSIVIVVVIIARMIMTKLPRKYFYLLWGIVGFRLLCPISLESRISIFNIRPLRNSVESIKELPLIQYGTGVAPSGTAAAVKAVNTVTDTQSHISITPYVLTVIWAAFAVGIVCYITFQYVKIKRDLKNTTEIRPGMFVGHQISSPFVMGIIKPKIYMPSGLTDSELEYLTLHEKTHIRRGDTFFKAIGIMALALHWFNPLVWIAFALFVRDMEMSCDEEVIAKLGNEVKADYSMSLVSFARRSNNSKYIVVPIAFSRTFFGRKDVKMRIKNVLGYHGSSKLISTLALVLVASISLVCLFNATSRADVEDLGDETSVEDTKADDQQSKPVIISSDSDATPDVDQAGDEGVEITTDEDSAEGTPVQQGDTNEVNVPYTSDPAEVPFDQQPKPVTISSDSDADKAASENAKLDIVENTDNILNTPLPVFANLPVQVILNLPKGTSAEGNPELELYYAFGKPLESDTFSVYYTKGASRELINEYIDVLENKYDFTKDDVYDFGENGMTYIATNSKGLSVTLEMLHESGIFRVSFYTRVNGAHAFSSLG